MNEIIFVDKSSQIEIENLRMSEYAKASGFELDLNSLKWKSSDNDSYIMAAKSKNEIISTMRGEVISDLLLLEHKLECPWSFSEKIDLPVLLLSRAATLSSYRNAGLNLVLRYWFLQLAFAHNIQFVIGTFVSGSPRENTLREMGYQFYQNDLGWQQSSYRSLRPVIVAALNLKTHGKQALEYCQTTARSTLVNYKFASEFPELRIVRSL